MNRLRDISLILIGGLLFYFIDILTSGGIYKNCFDNLLFHLLSLIHHIYNVFLQFGWLSNDIIILHIYLAINILTILHWITNNDLCILTEGVNSMCGFSKNKYFRDIWYFTGIKKFKYYILSRYIYIFITSMIAIYKIKKESII
jgi:hypothetical protein